MKKTFYIFINKETLDIRSISIEDMELTKYVVEADNTEDAMEQVISKLKENDND